MQPDYTIKFRSPINRETSYGQTRLTDDAESVIDLYFTKEGDKVTYVFAEWDIPELEETEHIGMWFEAKAITDYDGVFDLPSELISYMETLGFDMSYVK